MDAGVAAGAAIANGTFRQVQEEDMGTEMISFDAIVAQLADGAPGEFAASAEYYPAMDMVLYLREDVRYRADRIDPFLTLLWHPTQERAVGVKLKGWRYIFQRLQSILASAEVPLKDSHFVPLTLAFEVALTAGMGAEITESAEQSRLQKKYEEAKRLLADVRLDLREPLAA